MDECGLGGWMSGDWVDGLDMKRCVGLILGRSS